VSRYDVVIVGARCAGAATAMLLARRGLKVLLVDRSRYGSDTLSTHALMRAGVLQLHRWGVLDKIKAAGTPLIRTVSFHYDDNVVEVPLKPQDGVDGVYAPRRTVIDAALVDAAREAGAETAFDDFIESYSVKYEKAADCLEKDRDALLAFYDFPAEHWKHLRTTNPIESTFATVRHRTIRAKGCLSNKTALAMVFKLVEGAQKSWRRLDGHNQLPKLILGVKFSDGLEVTGRSIRQPATAAA